MEEISVVDLGAPEGGRRAARITLHPAVTCTPPVAELFDVVATPTGLHLFGVRDTDYVAHTSPAGTPRVHIGDRPTVPDDHSGLDRLKEDLVAYYTDVAVLTVLDGRCVLTHCTGDEWGTVEPLVVVAHAVVTAASVVDRLRGNPPRPR